MPLLLMTWMKAAEQGRPGEDGIRHQSVPKGRVRSARQKNYPKVWRTGSRKQSYDTVGMCTDTRGTRNCDRLVGLRHQCRVWARAGRGTGQSTPAVLLRKRNGVRVTRSSGRQALGGVGRRRSVSVLTGPLPRSLTFL